MRKRAKYTPREIRVLLDMYRVVRSFSMRFNERVEHIWATGSECAAMIEERQGGRETWTVSRTTPVRVGSEMGA